MLNLDLIDNLYAGLTKEQQQELIGYRMVRKDVLPLSLV